MADRHLFARSSREKFRPHEAADLPVKFTHAIGGAGTLESEHRHAKQLALIFRSNAPERHELAGSALELLLSFHQRVLHQIRAEPVVTSFDRGVGGEEGLVAGGFNGLMALQSS